MILGFSPNVPHSNERDKKIALDKNKVEDLLESRSTFLYLHSLVSLFVKMSPGPKL